MSTQFNCQNISISNYSSSYIEEISDSKMQILKLKMIQLLGHSISMSLNDSAQDLRLSKKASELLASRLN